MKTSSSSYSYHRTINNGQMDLVGCIKECAAIGLDGIELLGRHFESTDKEYLLKIKKLCADLFLTISMVSAGGHLTISDDVKRAEEIEDIKKWIKTAYILGAPRIRFFCGSGSELEAGGKELYDKVKVSIQEVVEEGANYGIVMAMENHGGTTADQLLSLHSDINNEFFKFTLDTGNFPPTSQVGPDTYTNIEKCVPYATIVHAKFFDVTPDGKDENFDWLKIHKILADKNFRGFLSIEYEGNDDDEMQVMRRISGFLKTLR